MLCQLCNKNEATIHLTEIVNDQMVDLHICEICAKEKSVDISLPLAFKDVLSGLVDFTDIDKIDNKNENSKKCTNCGISYNAFKEKGRLGCAECYKSFYNELLPLIKNVHGSSHHLGKRPASFEDKYEVELELKDLAKQLKEKIELEEFEEAAQVRDKIRMLEAKRKEKHNE